MRKTSLLALSLALVAGAASAQQAQPAKAAGNAKIFVVNMERVYRESLLGKSYAKKLDDLRNELEAEKQKKQGDLNKMDAEIKALQDELDTKASLLSPEAAEKKRQDIVKRNRDRQAFFEDGQAELQGMEKKAQDQAEAMEAEYQVKIKPHIDAVVKERGIEILLDSRVVLANTPEYDISLDVINKSNDAERAAKPAATAAPKAPEKPAQQPPANPKP